MNDLWKKIPDLRFKRRTSDQQIAFLQKKIIKKMDKFSKLSAEIFQLTDKINKLKENSNESKSYSESISQY